MQNLVTFKDVMFAFCKDGCDVNVQFINQDVKSTGKLLTKQDLIFLVHKLEEYRTNANISFESDLEDGATLTFDGQEIEHELGSDQVVAVTPVRMIEILCNRYDCIAWITGYNTLYTLGYGMVIYDERAM